MGEFEVHPDSLKEVIAGFESCSNELELYQEEVKTVASNLKVYIPLIIPELLNIRKQLEVERRQSNDLSKKLEEIRSTYKMTEAKLKNDEQMLKAMYGENYNPVYDGHETDGRYGGNQGSPMLHGDEMADIVRKYYPDFTDQQVEDYLRKLNSEGCGYVALINTLFSQYVGRETEFEETFGYPMYDENGDLNYNAVITDLYAATDNHNLVDGVDVINHDEDPSDTEGWGTNQNSRKYRFEMYLDNHGVEVDVRNQLTVTPETYNEIVKDGDLIVGVSPCILYDANGNELCNLDGGHAMTVTGVTEDGYYRVSSWGKEYYIVPSDQYNRIQFQQISY